MDMNEQHKHDATGEPAHVVPQVDRAESDRLAFLKEAERRRADEKKWLI